MSDDRQSEQPDDRPPCSWCGRKRLPQEAERGQVCDRCVRLLRDAGVSDEKIFAPPEERAFG